MNLRDYADALAYETAFWMQALANPEYPLKELGRLSLELSQNLRALAIIALVTQNDVDTFLHNLIRSGRTRLAYLARLHQMRMLQDHHWCAGRYQPFLDTIAARQWDLAREIVNLSPIEFRDGHEYEDDYCYAQVISRLIVDAPSDAAVGSLLSRFSAYVEEQTDARLLACRALAARDQAAFDEAFAGLLQARDNEIEGAKIRGQLEEPHIVAQRRIFVEGLAVLQVAERRGLRTEREYRYCPSIAREPMRKPFPGE